jgi:predicted lactoylglutathione lyase
MHCATGRGRLQSWANKDETFPSLCTRLQGLPNGMGDLYKTLVSSRFGPGYIKTPHFQDQLAVCHAHNKQLTVALIENAEGAQVILETRNGIPGSTFAAIENDIAWRSAAVQYSYLAALASHERDRAAAQIQAVKDAGGNAADNTFPEVRRQDERSSEAGTFLCGFEGCTNVYKTFDGLVKHVKHEKRGYGRTGSAATAKTPTHVGYTPKDPKRVTLRGDLPAEGRRSHHKKTWAEDVGQ